MRCFDDDIDLEVPEPFQPEEPTGRARSSKGMFTAAQQRCPQRLRLGLRSAEESIDTMMHPRGDASSPPPHDDVVRDVPQTDQVGDAGAAAASGEQVTGRNRECHAGSITAPSASAGRTSPAAVDSHRRARASAVRKAPIGRGRPDGANLTRGKSTRGQEGADWSGATRWRQSDGWGGW